MKLHLLFLYLLVASFTICSTVVATVRSAPLDCKRTEVYVVRPNDTLWSIAEKYAEKNTYGRVHMPEFVEGFRQNPHNYDVLLSNRLLQPGDKIEAVYWVAPQQKGGEEENGK